MRSEDVYISIQRGGFAPFERSLVCRIVLNLTFDEKQYPVDLSEVLSLPSMSFAMIRSFVAYRAECGLAGSASNYLVEKFKAALQDADSEVRGHA
jgi:hypothetical protein